MSNQIQIRWNSGMSREDFQASREAIHNFPNRDAVTVSLGIKGELSEGDLDQILKIASRSNAEVKVTLTGTFESGKQLRLFGPPENQTAMEVIQGRGERAGFQDPDGPDQAEPESPGYILMMNPADGTENGAGGESAE